MQNLLLRESGFVIHTAPLKEHECLIDFLTVNYGRISAVARFSKQGKNPLKAILQPYIPLKIEFVRGKSELWRVTGASVAPLGSHGALTPDLKVPEIFFAQYLNELLYHLYRHQGNDPQLFASYLSALEAIHANEKISLSLRQFENTLLSSLGYEVSFALSGNTEGFDDEESYMYSPEIGFMRVSPLERKTLKVSCYSGRVMSAIARGQWQTEGCLGTLREIFATALNSLLNGRILHSKELYYEYQRLTQRP